MGLERNRQENQRIAEKLEEMAEILQLQKANPFRIRAYRRAADTVAGTGWRIRQSMEEKGLEGLTDLPNIGPGIAAAIQEMLLTGRWSQLERLRGTLDPAALLLTVPGIGPKLANRIHDELGIDTLEELEMAAYDGRLRRVDRMGARRIEALRPILASMLSRLHAVRLDWKDGPDAALILDVDREYREKASLGKLPRIAPRRFNPRGRSWLAVLHCTRDGWHFTALFSNSSLAHQLGRTRDWVVIYCYDDHHQEAQHTVVTETAGSLKGKRVVRGRETECRNYYDGLDAAEPLV